MNDELIIDLAQVMEWFNENCVVLNDDKCYKNLLMLIVNKKKISGIIKGNVFLFNIHIKEEN